MKTLIIHPADKSTDFLKDIYKDLPNVEVITDIPDRAVLLEKAAAAERVICLGHGTPGGLIDTCKMRLCIDDGFAQIFKRQPDNIYIWCNADVYMKEHALSGFATGMFISEVLEAKICNVPATESEIEKSGNIFTAGVGRALKAGMTNEEVTRLVLASYISNSGRINKVIEYNRPRMFAFDSGVVTACAHMPEYEFAGQCERGWGMEKSPTVAGNRLGTSLSRVYCLPPKSDIESGFD